jgi:hypothetical protein
MARCGADASVHIAHSELVTVFAEIITGVRGILWVSVEVLTDPTILVKLPNGNDGRPADAGVFHYHGIRVSKLTLNAVISSLLGVSNPPSPAPSPFRFALSRAEKTKFEKYS